MSINYIREELCLGVVSNNINCKMKRKSVAAIGYDALLLWHSLTLLCLTMSSGMSSSNRAFVRVPSSNCGFGRVTLNCGFGRVTSNCGFGCVTSNRRFGRVTSNRMFERVSSNRVFSNRIVLFSPPLSSKLIVTKMLDDKNFDPQVERNGIG
jgi:hypothetical protein